jgi:hypothetical protein
MALVSECTPLCAHCVLDTADIVKRRGSFANRDELRCSKSQPGVVANRANSEREELCNSDRVLKTFRARTLSDATENNWLIFRSVTSIKCGLSGGELTPHIG